MVTQQTKRVCVKHCGEKAKFGQEIPVENMRANGEIFFVESMTSKDVTYEVLFGDATSYFSRECFEQKKEPDAMQTYVYCNGTCPRDELGILLSQI